MEQKKSKNKMAMCDLIGRERVVVVYRPLLSFVMNVSNVCRPSELIPTTP